MLAAAEDGALVSRDVGEPVGAGGDIGAEAEFVPDGAPRERLGLFHQGEAFVAAAGCIRFAETFRRIEKAEEDRLAGGAGADDVGGEAVDGGVEEIEGDEDAVPGVAAGDFEEEVARGVVEDDDVIAVPADGA